MHQASDSAAFTDDRHARRTAVMEPTPATARALGASVGPAGEWPIRFAPAGAPSVDCRAQTTATRARGGTLVDFGSIVTDAPGNVVD